MDHYHLLHQGSRADRSGTDNDSDGHVSSSPSSPSDPSDADSQALPISTPPPTGCRSIPHKALRTAPQIAIPPVTRTVLPAVASRTALPLDLAVIPAVITPAPGTVVPAVITPAPGTVVPAVTITIRRMALLSLSPRLKESDEVIFRNY